MFPTDIPFSHGHSHYSSYNARRSCILVVSHPVPVAERRDNKGVLKKQLKDQHEKLDDLDTRLSRVEAIQERQEGYRRLRVEQCAGLDTLWNSVESKEVPAAELRSRTASVLEHNVFRRHLKRRLRKTSRPKHRSCRGKRAVPTRAARGALADRVALRDLVEWVKSVSSLLRVSRPVCCMRSSVKKLIGACTSWGSWQGQTDACKYIPTGVQFKEKAKARARARPKERVNKRARQPANKMWMLEAGTTTLFLLGHLVQKTIRQGPP